MRQIRVLQHIILSDDVLFTLDCFKENHWKSSVRISVLMNYRSNMFCVYVCLFAWVSLVFPHMFRSIGD